MKNRTLSKDKIQRNKLSNAWRFFLLPLSSLLYSYGIISFGVVFAFFVVYIIRRDLVGFQEITLGQLLTIIIGVIVFLPARKLRRYLLDNP